MIFEDTCSADPLQRLCIDMLAALLGSAQRKAHSLLHLPWKGRQVIPRGSDPFDRSIAITHFEYSNYTIVGRKSIKHDRYAHLLVAISSKPLNRKRVVALHRPGGDNSAIQCHSAWPLTVIGCCSVSQNAPCPPNNAIRLLTICSTSAAQEACVVVQHRASCRNLRPCRQCKPLSSDPDGLRGSGAQGAGPVQGGSCDQTQPAFRNHLILIYLISSCPPRVAIGGSGQCNADVARIPKKPP